ncbi:AfsA-related hotdog domain-containing protein [Paracoccus sp. (in: a-proteobacteria)]|uniref:AfsA-related hotdog domain-containing protein n=1 Tax=Paracoccus sp. TaxID=267 RepID=UPI003A891C69
MFNAFRRLTPVNQTVRTGPASGDKAHMSGEVIVDQDHPFFYDHPLDHVPGLLLIEAAMQAGQLWAEKYAPTAHLTSLSVRFRRYCLHGRPVHWALSYRDGSGRDRLQLRLAQGDIARAEIDLALTPGTLANDSNPTTPLPAPDMPLVPAEAARLGKHDPANIMISAPQPGPTDSLSWLLPAREGNMLAECADDRYWHPLYLLEAWMQMLRHANSDPDAPATARMRDILAGLDLRLFAPVPRDAPIALTVANRTIVEDRFMTRSGTIGAGNRLFARVRMLSAQAGRPGNSQAAGARVKG